MPYVGLFNMVKNLHYSLMLIKIRPRIHTGSIIGVNMVNMVNMVKNLYCGLMFIHSFIHSLTHFD